MKHFQSTAISVVVCLGGLLHAPVAKAEESVTYDIFSDTVGRLAGIEYRDVSGKHLLRDVPLPWSLTVPVIKATSPTSDGAELRADWRPNFRTPATVGRVLQGHFVTVRISTGGQTLCESILDIGNATCYGNTPHTAENESSPGNLP
ncbi:hypothetical protein [Mycobacterium sp. E1747]|uniref:hypothetical protein n=1 Tax=Mycobacterium sp. E1747 TaxID=1834128 RepID=UPI000801D70F|nr:hypothetical protein [Mycobacterium sp. E1747]OBH11053.1 hypothetical protein A5695_20680 [Mycobacterium sp. E1747]